MRYYKHGIKGWINYRLKMKFKVRRQRFHIWWKNYKKRNFSKTKPLIDEARKKAIELVKLLLKIKETNLNYSPESKTRFLESEYAWITIESGSDSYLISIIDETRLNNLHYHEIIIPKEYGEDIVDEFDAEMERRFRMLESNKKKEFNNDLNRLVQKIKTANK